MVPPFDRSDIIVSYFFLSPSSLLQTQPGVTQWGEKIPSTIFFVAERKLYLLRSK